MHCIPFPDNIWPFSNRWHVCSFGGSELWFIATEHAMGAVFYSVKNCCMFGLNGWRLLLNVDDGIHKFFRWSELLK